MTYSLDKLREQIPLYLNKGLSEKERKEFEDALKQYPELKSELREFSEIKEVYKEIEKDAPLPSEVLYQRVWITFNHDETIPVSPRRLLTEAGSFKSLFLSPRVSWGVVAVQFVIILLLFMTLPRGDGFRTLTSREPTPAEGIKINVIFDKESKEKEIMDLLIKVGAIIIRGPSPEGLYIIELERNQDLKSALEELKKTQIVKFAEAAF
jgi:hypothetical protein